MGPSVLASPPPPAGEPLLALLVGMGVLAAGAWALWPRRGLVDWWRRFRALDDRVLIEDALKFLERRFSEGRAASLEGVAGALGISTGRASEILAEMELRELMDSRSGHLELTVAGRRYALQVMRAHRLWERYLADETGYDESEWHLRADRQEHRVSPEEVEALSARLGHPLFDPHGDPIPSPGGEVGSHGGRPLPTVGAGQRVRIVHVEDEPEVAYAQLRAEGLNPGRILRVDEVSATRVRLWSEEGEHILAPVVAANLSVVPLEQGVPEGPPAGLPLADLGPGRRARVLCLTSRVRGPQRRRLMDMGLVPGTVVEAELPGPFSDPVAYRVRGTLLALRREQAEAIRVEPVEAEVGA